MTDRKVILEMMLFDNLSNSFSSTGIVREVGILYFYVKIMSTKQWVDSKLTRAQKVKYWMWSGLQTNGNISFKVSEFILERAVMLR